MNEHRDGLGDDLWAEVVMQAGPDALDASWGACGLLIPSTAAASTWPFAHLQRGGGWGGPVRAGGSDSAFGALGGLTTQSLETAVA